MLPDPALVADPPPLVDAHCHLFLSDYESDLPEVLLRAKEAGVLAVVNSGLDAATSLKALSLAEGRQELAATAGWHPHDAEKCQKEDLLELERVAQSPGIVALGEIGLDFYRLHSPAKTQERVFAELLDLAAQLNLPVVVHTREAFKETMAILKPRRAALSRVLIHCFTGSWAEAQAYASLGCHFSIPGVLTFPKSTELRATVARIPRDLLLMETDGPYLAPVPRRGKRNEPAFLTHSLQALAETIGLSPLETARLTAQNAIRFFGLPTQGPAQ
ncbi:MAG: TatD family hydrolase [Deltaproteobacteria bacterium]|jgi:TatD DNase family protein|nr:TatD family hydrolase [Deltaproteobacteria bacterium]